MKKILFLTSMALVAAVSFSCNKENIEGNDIVNGEETVLYAPQTVITASSTETKTTLSGLEILWEKGDVISLFNENGTPMNYNLIEGNGTTSGKFEAVSELETGYSYAVYPAVSGRANGKSVAMTVAANQTYAAEGFSTDFPMGAVTSDGLNFTFSNLATVLSLPLQGDAVVRSISIEAVGGEGLAGAATVDFSGATPVLAAGNSATVTLDCGESGVQISEDAATVFNFVVIPGEYTKGFKVTVNETNGNSTVKTTGGNAMTLQAGSIFKIKSALPVVTPQGWNLVGGFVGDNTKDDWSSWIEMEGGNGLYYCSDVTVPADAERNQFKVRHRANEWYGFGNKDAETFVTPLNCFNIYKSEGDNNQGNLSVAAGTYDFYFVEDTKTVIVTEAGTAAFSVIGNINNTNYNTDFPMFVENGWLVAKGIEFTGNIFKIRTTGKWNENGSFNIGAPNEGDEIAVGGSFKAWSHTDTKNITVTGTEAGKKYDIYVDMKKHDPDNDADNMTVWVMPSGLLPGQSVTE